MKIALYIEDDISMIGGFNYSLSIILLCKKYAKDDLHFICISSVKNNLTFLKKLDIEAIHLKINIFDKILQRLAKNTDLYSLLRLIKIYNLSKLDKLLIKNQVDLIYFTSPSFYALYLQKHNYIFTAFDLCQRDYPEFPESNFYKSFEKREYLYNHALKKAVKIVTESNIGKENIIRRYAIDENRIAVLPLLPSFNTFDIDQKSAYYDIKMKYKISGDYIFYPAQLWPHKNHKYILQGLKILNEKFDLSIHAVFSGGNKGNLKYLEKYAEKLGVEKQIHFSGFVSFDEIPLLYKQSIALVMPSYFGPSNLPPLEAIFLGVPPIYSDIPGAKEQFQDAFLPLDLKNPVSLANHLHKLLMDKNYRLNILEKGKKMVENFDDSKHWSTLYDIFNDFKYIQSTWKEC